ncbi:hypothetical protein GQ43DRAFT_476971 [Delitschia confertaspora ATCC 74209]|uniref:SET domain-containing protein n=1 Tax=Delitschia confertaspora ATCC 74209 TaxID=1513339 RepID=A0A9P4MTZ2_9PLEO|nr:hypothetical protein GQ43DRAFT_476971 [Delitschia confertaspora ATCC 74209]
MEYTNTPAASILSERLSQLDYLLQCVSVQPYSIPLRLKIAKVYQSLGYPDLAIGEAYLALVLLDEISDEGEYYEQATEAATADAAATDSLIDQPVGKEEPLIWAMKCWSNTAYTILVDCLINCACLRSAFDYNSRALKAFPESAVFKAYKETLSTILHAYCKTKNINFQDLDVQDYPDRGFVRRELYPWNKHEPDRYAPETLEFLNEEIAVIAPKLEVRVTELPILSPENASNEKTPSDQSPSFVKQLGVFAKEDLAPGEEILKEKSILTAVGRLHDSFCDACSASLPNSRDEGKESPIPCEECDEVFFCSPQCHELSSLYHPALCDVSFDLSGVPAKEAADSLYSLLLLRALAMAETQDMHPLDLKEVKFIWGDYHGLDLPKVWKTDSDGQLADPFGGVPQTLPFSFEANILRPLHMLEKMDINIFEQSPRYSFWVFNTLYSKFRGTASARQGLDGRPEVGAVHPLWCLANHSCDPNVRWEWQGSIRFWVREKLVEWEGRPETERPGLKEGEEVLSHYCDVRLPVRERREWAVGALGGNCMCRRCVWEEAKEKRKADTV